MRASGPEGQYFTATYSPQRSIQWSGCRWESAIAPISLTGRCRCSAPSAPLPRSSTRLKPAADTRYDEAGESGPGTEPEQPSTVSLMLHTLVAGRLACRNADHLESADPGELVDGADHRTEEAGAGGGELGRIAGGD